MANLSGHAAGNGGYRQGDPTVSFDSLLLGRQHHTKPGPRHGPTRLRGEDPVDPLLLGGKKGIFYRAQIGPPPCQYE
jgi:hypothetical protein